MTTRTTIRSTNIPTTTANNANMMDYLLSQQLAMEEYQHVPRPPLRRASSEQPRTTTTSTTSATTPRTRDNVPYRVSMDHYQQPNHNHTDDNPHKLLNSSS